jgi:aspartate carbamoyltransferase catalytic subunit
VSSSLARTPLREAAAHVVSLHDWDVEQMRSLFDLAEWISAQSRETTARIAPGMIVGYCFYQNSTRTRLSFEAAARRVGGSSIGFADIATTRAGDFFAESLEDTVRVVAGYSDALVLRHVRDDAAETAAAVAGVPVISAGCGEGEHPTQGLLDAWTLTRVLGDLAGSTVGLVGDPTCRAVRSMLIALCHLGIARAAFLPVPGTGLSEDETATMRRYGVSWMNVDSAADLLRVADAISMIPFDLPDFHVAAAPQDARRTTDRRFVFDRATLRRAGRSVPIVHTGPRGIELADDTLELPAVH